VEAVHRVSERLVHGSVRGPGVARRHIQQYPNSIPVGQAVRQRTLTLPGRVRRTRQEPKG
jgi:hypothetical protein